MTESQTNALFRRLVHRIAPYSRFLRTWPLTGGVSARVTGLEVAHADGRTSKLLVRQHGDVDRARNPYIARDEFKLLNIAHAHGLAAPKPYDVDDSCELFPNPVLILEYVEGETHHAPTDLDGYLRQTATALANIHRVHAGEELSFLPRQGKGFGTRPYQLDDSLNEGRIRNALEAAWPLPQLNHSVLLHGDYWPGNLVWQGDTLAAVIDWEDAQVGDPLGDLANSRLELLWAFGIDAMHAFTNEYRALAAIDSANLPYWDLCASLRPCSTISTWGLDDLTEQRMRDRHREFVAQALARLRAG